MSRLQSCAHYTQYLWAVRNGTINRGEGGGGGEGEEGGGEV